MLDAQIFFAARHGALGFGGNTHQRPESATLMSFVCMARPFKTALRALPRGKACRPIQRGASSGTSSAGHFVGAPGSEYSPELKFWDPNEDHVPPTLPTFRVIDDLGCVVPGAETHVPDLSREMAMALQETMLKVSEFDRIFNEAQRQGRITFYLTSRGEEGCAVGSCAALEATDWVLPQYRELGVRPYAPVALPRHFTHVPPRQVRHSGIILYT